MRTAAGIRAVLLAALAFALSTSAHSVGGGEVSPGPALLVMVLTLPAVIAICRGRYSLVTTSATLLALQAATHVTLSATSGPAIMAHARGAGHHHIAIDTAPTAAHSGHGLDLRMVLSHLVATLALTYCLTALDRHLHTLVQAVLPRLPGGASPLGFATSRGMAACGFRPLHRVLVRARLARGPPLLAV